MFPALIPLCNHELSPHRQFLLRKRQSELCLISALSVDIRILVRWENRRKVNHAHTDRGWFSWSTERIHDIRYMEYFIRNVEWLGNHLPFVLWSHAERELKIKHTLTFVNSPKWWKERNSSHCAYVVMLIMKPNHGGWNAIILLLIKEIVRTVTSYRSALSSAMLLCWQNLDCR